MYGLDDDIRARLEAAAQRADVPLSVMDRRKFSALEKRVCDGKNSQGVIALVQSVPIFSLTELIERSYEQADNPLLVILDGITDPHNFGAIARSAECAGAHGVVITEQHSAPVTATSMKASAGALEHISLARVATMEHVLKDLQQADFSIIGTDDNATNAYTDDLYSDTPIALIIGSEGDGMSAISRKYCDTTIAIPMLGKVSSLNASVASGVVLFEILRQRGS
jgi:23S rRNA (guanosine2251-2'-O)-methyltransferase